MYQVVVAFGARFAPQRPGDGIYDGGFSRAVVAGNAGGMNRPEGKRRRIALIRHEVAHLEIYRNHTCLAVYFSTGASGLSLPDKKTVGFSSPTAALENPLSIDYR
jgi:hypothetical protein